MISKAILLKHLNAFIFCSSLIMTTALYSQESKTFPLWESDIPNAISNDNYLEKPVYEGDLLKSTSQVSTPTLTVFTPKKGEENGAAIVICPGGGYQHLSMLKEGSKVGEWMASMGITAFVLKYRLPNDAIMTNKTIGPLQDAQEAMRYVRRHAKHYNLDTNKIGVLGFSAGGHLASTLSTHYNRKVYNSDKTSAKPNFSILIYPVVSMKEGVTHQGSKRNLLGESPSEEAIKTYSNALQIDDATPPTFLVHATDDHAVPVENSLEYYAALKKHNVPVALHIFENGGHGFGLSNPDIHLYWQPICENWLRFNKLITEH